MAALQATLDRLAAGPGSTASFWSPGPWDGSSFVLAWWGAAVGAAALAALTIVITALDKGLILFAWHPWCMVVGCCLMFVAGVLVMVSGPVTQGARRARFTARSLHVKLNVAGCVLVALGLAAILSHRFRAGKTLIPKTLHGWAGAGFCLVLVLQGLGGWRKLVALEQLGVRSLPLHSDLGTLIAEAGLIVCAMGLYDLAHAANARFLVGLACALLAGACLEFAPRLARQIQAERSRRAAAANPALRPGATGDAESGPWAENDGKGAPDEEERATPAAPAVPSTSTSSSSSTASATMAVSAPATSAPSSDSPALVSVITPSLRTGLSGDVGLVRPAEDGSRFDIIDVPEVEEVETASLLSSGATDRRRVL